MCRGEGGRGARHKVSVPSWSLNVTRLHAAEDFFLGCHTPGNLFFQARGISGNFGMLLRKIASLVRTLDFANHYEQERGNRMPALNVAHRDLFI